LPDVSRQSIISLPAEAGTGSAEIIVMSKLSIIMPVLNEGEGIAAALDALAVLRALGTEVMVVDGGSRDATIQRARLRADRVIAAPRGRGLQMNAGADKASGDVLLFLHADTRLPADADHVVLNGLERSGRVWGRFDAEIEGQSPLLLVIAWLMNLRSRLTGIATGDQAMFVRRDAFQAAGGFAAIPLMEDVELCKRLRRVSRPLCLRERVVTSGRRWEKDGVLNTVVLMWRLRLAYFLGADPKALARRYGYE
jgi:rSAM/selenodomain-associated transferase 2